MSFNFVIVAPYEELANLAKQVCADLNIKGEILVGDLQEGIEVIKQIDYKNIEVIISRGGTATVINKEINIPVIEISVSGFDLIHAVAEAKEYGKNIGVIGFRNVIYGCKSLDHILGVNICELEIRNENEVEETIIEASKRGIEVIVGDAVTVKHAQKMNIKSVLVTSGKEAISMALREAEKVAEIRKKEKVKAEQLKAILDFTYEGIIATDNSGRISMVNPAAEKILKTPIKKLYGSYCNDVIPNLKLNKVLESGKSKLGQLSRIGEKLLVQNIVPVISNEETTGIVSTFQDVNYIQYIETKVRKELLLKGHLAKYTFIDIATNNYEMKSLISRAKEFSKVDSTILITGETGSGKELMSQSIHNFSKRKDGPFVAVNCAAIPESLLESELFGYEEGAFTGARRNGKKGFFELAHGGTLFLDEIGEIPLRLQAHLLRVLQQKVIVRVGGDRVIPTDVRIIAATHKDLDEAVRNGNFRRDLYYRINVLRLKIPPLRERTEDIALLVEKIADRKCVELGKDYLEFEDDVISIFKKYSWKGNIRELENIIETLIIMTREQKVKIEEVLKIFPEFNNKSTALTGTLDEIEKNAILTTLKKNKNNKEKTCKQLGISETTLWRRLKKYKINNAYIT